MTENIRFHKNNITLTDAEKSRGKIGGAGVTLASLSSGRKLKLRLKIVSISFFRLLKACDKHESDSTNAIWCRLKNVRSEWKSGSINLSWKKSSFKQVLSRLHKVEMHIGGYLQKSGFSIWNFSLGETVNCKGFKARLKNISVWI